MGRKRGVYYIDPEELKQDILQYKQTGVMSDQLGEKLIKIARHYASKPNFSGYSYKEDFIGDAILRMVDQIDKIDLDHPNSNPFWYLTQQCYWIFVAKINKEKKYTQMKEEVKDHFFEEVQQNENINFKKNIE